MATFSYQAKDKGGNTISGVIDAPEERSAANTLREMGYFPLRINVVGAATMPGTAPLPPGAGSPMAPRVGTQSRIEVAPFLNSVPLDEMSAFYRQMATLVNAGVVMVQALTAMARQTRSGRLRSILEEATASVASGNPFSVTMAKHPAVFSEMQLEMIRAAETSGMMERMCNRIADYLERELEIRRKMSRETLYPKIVLFVAGLVVLLLGFLKAGAQGIMGQLTFAAITAASIVGAIWLFKYLQQYPAIGAAWDNVKMLIPGVGGVARKYATARFTRALAALYGAGVLLPTAVAIAARACGNRAIGQRMVDLTPMLMSGKGIAATLEASGLLAPIAVQMARTGEQTGNLDVMMDKVADYLESEADQKSHQYAIYLGVAAIIVAGIVVAVIAISFYVGQITSLLKE